MIRDFLSDWAGIVIALATLISVGCVFILVDMIASNPIPVTGVVIDKYYKAESVAVGTGTGVGSNGGAAVVTTVEIDPEEFLIIIRTQSGEVITANCEPELYYNKDLGDRVVYNQYKGLITNWVWSYKAID